MIDIMAQMAEQTQNHIPWVEYLIGSIILALTGGGAGGAALMHQRSRRRSEQRERDVCPLHEEFAAKLNERKEHQEESLKKVAKDVDEIKTDVKEGFKAVFSKFDELNPNGRVQT